MPTLVLLRHGKSDWSTGAADRARPLTARGRRQAAEAGGWLRDHGPSLDLAVVSVAARARETWALAAAQLAAAAPPRTERREAAYTFDGEDLRALVTDLPDDVSAVVLVGHNPALQELLESLTGEDRETPTSCLAVVRWTGGWAEPRGAELVAHGRPPA